MTDDRPKRIDLTDTTKEHGRTLVHLLGYHGDGGENESVLSVSTDLSPGANFPESGRIFVGTPQKSPLLEGYFPDLGSWSCSPDAADRLAAELKAAAAAARAAMARTRCSQRGCGWTCITANLPTSGWMQHTGGWLCLEHQPL